MARTRSTAEDAGNETPATSAAENQLLRHQLRDMTQQLTALTEHVHTLSQRTTVPIVMAQTTASQPTAAAGGPATDNGATAIPPPTATTTEIPRASAAIPTMEPIPTVLRAPVEGQQGGSSSTPIVGTPTTVGEAAQLQAEKERKRANLTAFMKYNPPVFEGETADPWVVEKWVDSMEKLFEDLIIENHERVPLAVHFLEGNARMWWKTTRPDPSTNVALPTWESFREKLFGAFFPPSVKKQMEDDLKHIQQGNRTVMEYQREFVKLVNCVPFVIRDESHKAQLFVDGLRNNIFQVVQAADLGNFQQVVNRATLVERGFTVTRNRRESHEQDRDRKRSQPSSEGGSSSGNRPPKHFKPYPKNRNNAGGGQKQWNKPCIICRGNHRERECPQRNDHCFKCGKSGHIQYNCPLNSRVTTPVTAQPPPGKGGALQDRL